MISNINDKEYKGILIEIGLNIGFYRRKAGLTQAELAEETGLSEGYIGQLESPNLPYCPSMRALFSIAKVLVVNAADLIEIRK